MWHLNADVLCASPGIERLSQTAVFEWHSHFKDSQISVEDDKRSGQPCTSKMTENLKNLRTHAPRPLPNNP
jgi:hypothetical protein